MWGGIWVTRSMLPLLTHAHTRPAPTPPHTHLAPPPPSTQLQIRPSHTCPTSAHTSPPPRIISPLCIPPPPLLEDEWHQDQPVDEVGGQAACQHLQVQALRQVDAAMASSVGQHAHQA